MNIGTLDVCNIFSSCIQRNKRWIWTLYPRYYQIFFVKLSSEIDLDPFFGLRDVVVGWKV